MNVDLKNRLENYKFDSAKKYLDGEDRQTQELVKSLSEMYGNVGWMSGHMATIINNAIRNVTPDTQQEDDS